MPPWSSRLIVGLIIPIQARCLCSCFDLRTGSSRGTSSTTSSSDGKKTLRISNTWRGTPSTVTLFLDSISVTVPFPWQVLHLTSGSFTYISSPTMIFAWPCFTLYVMAYGWRHSYVKTDWCGTDASSRPVFDTMLYQKTASWGENEDFRPQLLWFDGASLIPLPFRLYTDLKYCLAPHFSCSSLKNFQTETYTVIYQHFYWAPSPETPQQLSLSLLLSLFWFFAISLLSQVHSQSWIGTVHGDNEWYQRPAFSNFLPHAAPLFHV